MDRIIDFHVNLLKEHYQSNISPYDEKIILEYRDKLIDLLISYFKMQGLESSNLAQIIETRFEEELGVN